MHDIKQVIVVRKDLHMRAGKIAAQVAHASMMFLLENNDSLNPNKIVTDLTSDEAAWINNLHKKIVCYCDSQDELEQLMLQAKIHGISYYPIWDAGLTEFKGETTLTCCAFGPCESNEIDYVTGHLNLA